MSRAEQLKDRLEERLGQPVDGLRRLSGGASRETWSFAAGGRPLIVQCSHTGVDLSTDARLMRAAARAGVPVPEVVFSDTSHLVSAAVEGETIARKLLRDDDFSAARPRLAGQIGAALAGIHAMPAEEFADLSHPDPLGDMRRVADGFAQPHPTFDLAFRWLENHRPDVSPSESTLVHGDFRTGNFIVGPDGLRAVIDWELAHIGDPMEDLGWVCAKPWRFGSPLPAGGFGSYDDLVDAYESAGGRKVDRDVLHWWELLANLRWGVICMMQTMTHVSGMMRSVELAAIGRRVCEAEWDVLELLP
ncbi:MAG TPA: phosphotransferase family protein [Acidimicrobiales bacterium]|nr:phosphotransferase family protein [Acidimicrobiales bacterium]